MESSNPTLRLVSLKAIPLLIGAMLVTTGVAVVIAGHCLFAYAGPEHTTEVWTDLFWIIFWTGLAEGFALLIGWVVCKRLGNQISELQEELTNLTRAVLHDIKTPITHMRNAAEECITGERAVDELPGVVFEACERLSEVIGANAEIASITSQGNAAAPDAIDIAPIARQSIELLQPIAEGKGISLNAEIPNRPTPYPIRKAQFQHLVNNLLDNAIKFTPRGGRICVSLSESSGRMVLRVSDTGIGIPKDKLPHIFERFYRADASRHTEGFGLGLSLVEAIVNASNGRIRVASDPQSGTTFTITLPRA